MNYVCNEENNNIIRVGNELLQKYYLTSDNEEQPKTTSERFTKADTKFHYHKYTSKVMHGYFNRTTEKDGKITIITVNHGQKTEN